MQIRIRRLYRAAPETIQRAMQAFAAHFKRIFVEHNNVLKLRPLGYSTNGEHTRGPSLLVQKIRDIIAIGNIYYRNLIFKQKMMLRADVRMLSLS